MNRSPIHSKPLIFRAGSAAIRVNAAPDQLSLDCQMPLLAGPGSQVLAHGATILRSGDDWLLQGPEGLAGLLVSSGGAPLAEESYQLYRRLFAITRGLNRYRIWNYVPWINRLVGGVENYVAFNAGRHRAFTEQFGGIAMQDLSAASAVGTQGGALALAFAAGPAPVHVYENPLQTPAAHYPDRYGPNAPLFARGSKVRTTDGLTCWHLSGTASIRDSETIGDDIVRQLEVTLENIERIVSEMAVPKERQAAWKVFLRKRGDLDLCRERLAAVYPGEVNQMMFLEADICRSDLLLEIEGMFYQASPR
jgi:chorismatase